MTDIPIGDPRPSGAEGPAGDQRPSGEEGPAGDPRPTGEAAPVEEPQQVEQPDEKPAKAKKAKPKS
jgi:hypothetical protein